MTEQKLPHDPAIFEAMYRLRQDGKTWREIGAQYGVNHETARAGFSEYLRRLRVQSFRDGNPLPPSFVKTMMNPRLKPRVRS